MIRCSNSCMDWFVPVPENIAQVDAGTVYSSNSPLVFVLETAIKYFKGTAEEKEIYYHHVLEAKLVLGDGFVVSIGMEFIENEAEEYHSIADMGEAEGLDRQAAREYPRKGRVKEKYHMEWVAEIDYREYKLTLLALETETETERTGEKEAGTFH